MWLHVSLLAPLAIAGDPVTEVWSTTAVEVRPNLDGEPLERVAERLGFDVPFGDGWRVGFAGGIRSLSLPGEGAQLDLWRGLIEHRTANHRITLGRMIRQDPRGLQRLDGVGITIRDDTPVRWGFWGGRRWHPEVTSTFDFLVAGAELRVGRATHHQLSVGVEGRQELGETHPRSWIAGELRDVVGHRLSLLVESGAERRFRGAVNATWVAGRTVDVGLDVRWEGLPPATALDQPRSPLLWLAPEGYGVAALSVRWVKGRWSARAAGGPVARRDAPWAAGGRGQASLAWQSPHTRVHLFGTAAGIDDAVVAGGGGGVALEGTPGLVDATIAGWSLRPIDGDRSPITEARLIFLARLMDRVRGNLRTQVLLGGRGSVGVDRQLAPFTIGGAQLTVRLGGAS